MDEFLKQLAGRLRTYDSEIVSADEVRNWPEGKLDELLSKGILSELQPSRGYICDQCEENCYIEPDIRTNLDTGEAVGIFVCTRNPDMGRIEVDLNRLRQWKISGEKLEALGYGKKTQKRKRRISSELTPKETEVWTLIYVEKKTQQQAAIEMQCTPQDVSKLLKKAEAKMNAKHSRSINLSKAQKLPEDKRGQTSISNEDI